MKPWIVVIGGNYVVSLFYLNKPYLTNVSYLVNLLALICLVAIGFGISVAISGASKLFF